jgi:dsRNA-specific ribonuclease
MADPKTTVLMGLRDESFKAMLINIFKMGKISPKYFDILTNENSMREYEKVFTSSGADPKNNYQVYEILGDSTANKCIVWYFYRRFPQLHCPDGVKVIARLKINYVGKKEFASIGEGLGFFNYITATVEEKTFKKISLLEDVFEAFIGLTEYLLDSHFQIGVGYSIVYEIFESIFDKKEISLKYEDLYDAKTRVKEFFDKDSEKRQHLYFNKHDEETGVHTSILYCIHKGNKIKFGEGKARSKGDAEQIAAQESIDKHNTARPILDFYKYFC